MEPSRKKQRQPETWKKNIAKKLREQGKKYCSQTGKIVQARKMKPVCNTECFYSCTQNFSETDRANIFQKFWALTDKDKQTFYCKFVKKEALKRKRVKESDKKKNTFSYSLGSNENIHRVCKLFFLNTLGISAKRIYYCFQNMVDKSSEIPMPLRKGKSRSNFIEDERVEQVIQHIRSFPTVDSHYCRASTSRQYLSADLSITKMYALYVEQQPSNPVSERFYRDQFNHNFNLSFIKPRKDQCDRCVQFSIKNNATEDEIEEFNIHRNETNGLKVERDVDRRQQDPFSIVVCFDLQSVFNLPKGFASSFYYKRKINVYNMTATIIFPNKEKFTYCCVWDEFNNSRGGNEISSCIYKILNTLMVEHPTIQNIVMWSDSCVAQNKNQMMSTAILKFLSDHLQVKSIIQKFSEPGHSQIQEIDCVHSALDKYLKRLEIHSTLSLVNYLNNFKTNKIKLKVVEMQLSDFKSFSKISNQLNFSILPFTKIKVLQYIQNNLFTIKFKNSILQPHFQTVNIIKKRLPESVTNTVKYF